MHRCTLGVSLGKVAKLGVVAQGGIISRGGAGSGNNQERTSALTKTTSSGDLSFLTMELTHPFSLTAAQKCKVHLIYMSRHLLIAKATS